MSDFTVKGRLDLEAQGFVQGADLAARATARVTEAERQLTTANTALATSSTAVTNSVAAQANGFTKLAQQITATSSSAASQVAGAAGSAVAKQYQAMQAASQQYASDVARTVEKINVAGAYKESLQAAQRYSQGVVLGARANDTLADSSKKLKAANADTAASIDNVSGKLSAYQRQNLAFQLNDVFVQLASGQGVVRTFVQQGPQITQIFGGLGATLRAIPAGIGAALGIVGALTLLLGGAASSASQASERQRQFAIELRATGNAAGTTAAKLEQLVRSEAMRPGAGRADTASSLGGLLLNSNLDEDRLARTLAVARDYARVTGQELPAAAQQLSKALDGSSAAARQLDQQFNFLSAAELEQIRKFEQQGDKGAVVATVLTAIERNFKGANEQGISPTTKALNDLGAAWTRFETSLGNSTIVRGLLSGTAATLSGAAQVIGGAAGSGGAVATTVSEVQQLRAELVEAQKAVNTLRTLDPSKAINPANLQRDIALAQKRVEDIRAQISAAERSVTNTAITANEASAQGEITRAERELKEYADRLQQLNTVAQQRSKLTTEAGEIKGRIELGGLSPDQLSASNERLKAIEGQLYALGTPSELLQRKLNLDSQLAALPPHLRAAQQAWDETYRAARTAGDARTEAEAKADQARRNALATQSSATAQQISLLSAEAQGALAVAEAYNKSRSAGLAAAAALAARQAEDSGSIAPGTASAYAQETLQKDAASAIAAQAEKNRGYGEEVEALNRLVAAEKVSAEAAREAERSNRVAAIAVQLRAQAEASGSDALRAAAERQIAIYDQLSRQQLEVDRRRAAQQLNTQFDPQANYEQRIAQLQVLRDTGVLTERTVAEATRQYELERLEASRSATDGMLAGLRRYADEASNAGKAAAQGVQQGLQSMENALVQFVTTGQINFSNLANSIIADLARIAIRQGITEPLVRGLGSVLGNIFSGASGGGGFNPAANSYGGGSAAVGYFHAGGIVGGAAPSRQVPMDLFANARRYHEGGVVLGADEVPIIARKGERVLTEAEQTGMGAAPRVTVQVINKGPPLEAQQGQTKSDGQGGFTLDVLVDLLDDKFAQRANSGSGKFMGVLRGKYGVTQVPRR